MDIAQLGLSIRSDGVVVATDRLNKFSGAGARAEGVAGSLVRAATRAGVALAGAFSIAALARYADQWSDLQSQVGAAIKDMEAAPQMMQRMVDLANASYSPLAQTVEVYSRNVGVLRDLGYSANQAADFTEALNHMLVITATRGERAASVQNALAKAMAVGKLQADGLESVLANGGRVAEALAAELDTTVSGLRGLASQGLITGDVIARAMINPLSEVREEAAKMPATIADAVTRIQTNLTAMIGTFDKTHEISGRVAEAVLVVADNLNMLVPVAGALATVMTVSLLPAIGSATVSFGLLTAAMLANPFVQLGLLAGGLAGTILYLNQQQGLAAQAAQTHAESLTTNANAIEVAKTSSQGFRDSLRSQIEMQVAAAKAALDEAGAQYQAAKVKAAAADKFGQFMNLGANALGMPGRDVNYGDDILNNALAGINTAYGRLQDLEGQLGKLGEVESTYKPLVHTLAGMNSELTGVAGAASAANDNLAELAAGMAAAEVATRRLTEIYNFGKDVFGSFIADLKTGIKDGQSLWESLGNAAANALDKIADKALSMAANGIWDMIFGGIMGSLGGGFGGNPLSLGAGGLGFLGGGASAWGPSFDGGGHTGYGPRVGGLDGLGGFPAILHPNETVIDHTRPYAANQNQANDNRVFAPVININGSSLSQEQMTQAIADALDQYDRKRLPRRVNELKNNSMVVNG